MAFFLRCLEKQTIALESKLNIERKLDTLPELSQTILKLIRERRKATVKDFARLTDKNRNTIKGHLKKLVADKRIRLNGTGKGSWYGPVDT